jgi:hypothetical protein
MKVGSVFIDHACLTLIWELEIKIEAMQETRLGAQAMGSHIMKMLSGIFTCRVIVMD